MKKVWLYIVGTFGFESLAKKIEQRDNTIRNLDKIVSSYPLLHQVVESFALWSSRDDVSCFSIYALEDNIRRGI